MGRLVMTSESCGVARRRLELGRRRSGCALGRVVTSAAIVDFVLEETVLRAPFESRELLPQHFCLTVVDEADLRRNLQAAVADPAETHGSTPFRGVRTTPSRGN